MRPCYQENWPGIALFHSLSASTNNRSFKRALCRSRSLSYTTSKIGWRLSQRHFD
jgi:hypothetical protein